MQFNVQDDEIKKIKVERELQRPTVLNTLLESSSRTIYVLICAKSRTPSIVLLFLHQKLSLAKIRWFMVIVAIL